jgi:hypothetical protein
MMAQPLNPFHGEYVALKDLKDISSQLLMKNKKLKLLDAKEYDNFSHGDLRFFCHQHARYGLPTTECVNFIREVINGRTALEIGSGHGDLGYHLNIRMTDSKIQEDPGVRLFYMMGRQPVINYPPDIRKIEAIDAVKKWRPQVVVGSWITRWVSPDFPPSGNGSVFGVKEDEILDLVETYILVGNLDTHGDKEIMKRKHREIANPFLKSRAKNPENNRIFIWDRE